MCQHMGESRAVWASHKLAKNPIRARLIAGERGGGGGTPPGKTLPGKHSRLWLRRLTSRAKVSVERVDCFFFLFFFSPRAQRVACEVKIKRLYALQETQPHSSELHIMEGGGGGGGLTSALGNHAGVGRRAHRGGCNIHSPC